MTDPAPMCGPLVQAAWLDDPPSLVLEPRYLADLRALPLRTLAVMVDGPRPGLADSRWRLPHLDRLAGALPDRERVLTVWAAAHREAIDELGAQLPELCDALGASAVEVDAEPVGEWARGDVRGYPDEGGDRGSLDEASEALADVLAATGLPVEVTVFPGALRYVAPLIRALLRRGVHVRVVLQCYAVRTRGPRSAPRLIDYEGPLGPRRLPGEALTAAREAHPDVELVAGLAAYDQRGWHVPPGVAMHAAVASAVGAGVSSVRWWSAKHLIRKSARSYASPAVALLG